jgi:hypothetical protein
VLPDDLQQRGIGWLGRQRSTRQQNDGKSTPRSRPYSHAPNAWNGSGLY